MYAQIITQKVKRGEKILTSLCIHELLKQSRSTYHIKPGKIGLIKAINAQYSFFTRSEAFPQTFTPWNFYKLCGIFIKWCSLCASHQSYFFESRLMDAEKLIMKRPFEYRFKFFVKKIIYGTENIMDCEYCRIASLR